MTIKEIRSLPYDSLKKLSLETHPNGNPTWDAEMAYGERKRRCGSTGNLGAYQNNRCTWYQADIDYYGTIYI